MELILIRHTDALPLGAGSTQDTERPLSPEGQALARALGQALQRRGVRLCQERKHWYLHKSEAS